MANLKWVESIVPTTLHLECGTEVPHVIGTPVFNYYDHKLGVIERTATYPQAPTMPVHERDGGAAWWVTVRHDDGTMALLDQSRLCSVEHAQAQGWIKRS